MKNFLKSFPISIFSVVMGLMGTSLATEMTQNVFHLRFVINRAWLGIAFFFFIIFLIIYILKMILCFKEVKEEFYNPISLSFFSTISICIILLSQGFRTFIPKFALISIWVGSFLQIFFSFLIISQWIRQSHFEIQHMNPSWFIPIVGNFLIPVFAHQLMPVYLEWFFFSIATLFWVILLTILIYRLIFHHPLVEKLIPTLAILVAPPSIAAIGYFQLTGQRNPLVLFFFCSAFFFFVLLFFLFDLFFKIKYDISWWAYIFPLSAFSIASYFMSGVWFFLKWISLSVVIIINLLSLALLIITVIKLIDGKLFNISNE
ncbi:MAG: C4-dicarboxylate ABC transporter [Spirochaetes bacterium]|nr:C4-dicarboxylate ABC transporter [Spirochaetota bacterium]